jgi:predicted RNase H-like nuclease
LIAGVDGCRSGWLAVLDDEAGHRWTKVYPTFADLLSSEARLMIIDIPIGIMSAVPRVVDGAARFVLRHRASCVFTAPYRPMLAARSHEEACTIREAIDGKRCSRQAFAIIPKIAEVDTLMTPALQSRVLEGHPEVTFATMKGRPIESEKKSENGLAARLDALRPSFPEIDERAADRRLPGVGRDDLVDAYAMLWTARRVVSGAAVRLPTQLVNGSQRDARGLRAEMLA